MTLYKNKYRIESARCPNWDYTSNGYYFVTICTRDRQCFFGDIKAGKMELSDIGLIIAQEWQRTPKIRPNVQLDQWVVMPNHFHGIIIINNPVDTLNNPVDTFNNPVDTFNNPVDTFNNPVDTFRRNVSTDRNASTNNKNKSRLKSNSLGSIIGQFKSVCTKQIWKMGFTDFGWQSRFHDHIIRDEAALSRIRQYIINNPTKWEQDKNNPQS